MNEVKEQLQAFIKSLEYEVFHKGVEGFGVIDRIKIEIENIDLEDNKEKENKDNCGLENWYRILQKAHQRNQRNGIEDSIMEGTFNWLSDNCNIKDNVEDIRNFFQSIAENLGAVVNYVNGGSDGEENIKRILSSNENMSSNVKDCIKSNYRESIQKFVGNQCIDDKVREDVRKFLKEVLSSAALWIIYFYFSICEREGNIRHILDGLHRLIEGIRRGTVRQREFCKSVINIVDMLPYSEFFRKLHHDSCRETNNSFPGCTDIFYIASNCTDCYRQCVSALRGNTEITVYKAEIKGVISRIYPYEEDYKEWNFEGIVWFYLEKETSNGNSKNGGDDTRAPRILMGMMQIMYFDSYRGSFGSILLEFEPHEDRVSQDRNAISGIFRGRYIKLMRHEGNVWHVRVNTFPVEWIPGNMICGLLRKDSLLRQLVGCS